MNNNDNLNLCDAIEVIEEVLNSGGTFRMYPRGTSMLPLIDQRRDSVVLERREDKRLKKHDIVFYRRNNGAFILHRVMRVCSDGSYVMCGDNQTYLEKGVPESAIIARVSCIYKGDRQMSLRSLGYRLYTFFWTKMLLRRGVFFAKRCVRKIFRRRTEKK